MSLSFNKWVVLQKVVEDRELLGKGITYAATELWYPVFSHDHPLGLIALLR